MARKNRRGVKTVPCNFRLQEDTLEIIHEYAAQLEAEGPTMVRIGEREVIEMLVHRTKALLNDGRVSLRDLFYVERIPVRHRDGAHFSAR